MSYECEKCGAKFSDLRLRESHWHLCDGATEQSNPADFLFATDAKKKPKEMLKDQPEGGINNDAPGA